MKSNTQLSSLARVRVLFRYIPALNDRKDHIRALADIAHSHCTDWLEDTISDTASRQRLRQ